MAVVYGCMQAGRAGAVEINDEVYYFEQRVFHVCFIPLLPLETTLNSTAWGKNVGIKIDDEMEKCIPCCLECAWIPNSCILISCFFQYTDPRTSVPKARCSATTRLVKKMLNIKSDYASDEGTGQPKQRKSKVMLADEFFSEEKNPTQQILAISWSRL